MAVAERRQRERQARREEILDAAERTILRTGYQALRMDEVAEEAEVSKGTVYLYFENKDALCAAIAVRSLDRFIPPLKRHMTEAATGLGAIRRLLEFYCEFTRANPHHFRFAISWLSAADHVEDQSESFQDYRGKVGEILTTAVKAIERGKQDGSIRKDVDALPQAFLSWLSVLGVVMADLRQESFAQRIPMPMDFSQLVPLHIETIARALASEGESS